MNCMHILTADDAEMDKLEKEMASIWAAYTKGCADFQALMSSAEEKTIYVHHAKTIQAYLAEHAKVIGLARQYRNDDAKALIKAASQKLYSEAMDQLGVDQCIVAQDR